MTAGRPATLRRVTDGVDAVCHQAAMVGLGVDFGDAPGYVRDNDLGTAVLLAALHERDFRGRIVVASSMVVYGEGGYRCDARNGAAGAPRHAPISTRSVGSPRVPSAARRSRPIAVDESSPPDPRNVYAATKLHQEHLCFGVWTRARSSVVALRYHNVYGPRMPRDTPYAGVASIFRSALESGRAPQVFEDGGQRRDFVHVADVARANVSALTLDERVPVPTTSRPESGTRSWRWPRRSPQRHRRRSHA